jgi:hypothetical protein
MRAIKNNELIYGAMILIYFYMTREKESTEKKLWATDGETNFYY